MIRFLKEFAYKMLIVQAIGIAVMIIAGWILTIIQRDTYCPQQTFFTYQIQHLDRVPAWFVFVLLQMAVNGYWMFRLAIIEGGLLRPWRVLGAIGGPLCRLTRFEFLPSTL